MCGIHLVINSNSYSSGPDAFMRDAFLANQVRGVDSSGVFQIQRTYAKHGKERNVDFYKEALCGTDFIDTKPATDILKATCSTLATVGHVRAATTGQVNGKNAHPFLSVRADGSRIIGVHNGTLPNWRKMEGADRFDVDSAWLFSKLANDGIASFEGFDGAFCLVWYDSNHPNSMFIARNDKRPLFWAYSDTGKVMYAASELGMLGWLMARNNINPKAMEDGHKFQHPEPGHVYEINLFDPMKYTKTPFSKYDPTVKKYDKADVLPLATARSGAAVEESVPWTAGEPRYTPEAGSIFDQFRNNQQTKFFDAVKAALRTGRDVVEAQIKAANEETADTAEAVDKGEETLEGQIEERNFLYMHEPNTRNVSKSEEELAKKVGIFGLCTSFCGYFYDTDSGLLYGDFKTVENGKVHTYDAIVRGESEGGANIKYIHPNKLTRMVVVGIYKDPATPKSPFVILEDTDKSKKLEFHTKSLMEVEAEKLVRTVH